MGCLTVVLGGDHSTRGGDRLSTEAPTETATFPLDSFKEAAKELRRPFTPQAVKFKVQSTWPKDNPTGGLIVGYVDARLVVERLNLILPHCWWDQYEPVDSKHMICRLTVDGITRQDIGEGDGKGLYSDALKRAAVKFGIGVSIYAIPKMILNASNGQLKPATRSGKKTLEFTSDGEHVVRALYERWLDEKGKQAFGEPLDHGDVEDAQGDWEAEATAAPVSEAEGESANGGRLLNDDERSRVVKAIEDAGYDDNGLAMLLSAVGVEDTDSLTYEHAFQIRALIDERKEKQS